VAPADLQLAFRGIASNVAIITTISSDGPHGCTGTAWAEDPRSPFVVTPLERSGQTRGHVGRSRRFAASFLAANQADIARKFAKRGDRFAGVESTQGAHGLALIVGAAVTVECDLHASLEFGTYDLLVGRVVSASRLEGVPVLTFCDGAFGTHARTDQPHA
jgi:flavin reductase (DIM6/NTAB) family NADH-FMN oxidoreductase RutF